MTVPSNAGEVYQEILYYHRDNGIVPTRDRIDASFPNAKLPWDTEITVDEVIGEARRAIRTMQTEMFIGDLAGYVQDRDGTRMLEVDAIPMSPSLTEGYL